jgi:electron transport complex protein RnfG
MSAAPPPAATATAPAAAPGAGPAAPPPVVQTRPHVMVATLGLVSAICGLLIVTAYQGSLDAVKDNRRVALERAVSQVLPGAQRVVAYHALPDGRVVPAQEEIGRAHV